MIRQVIAVSYRLAIMACLVLSASPASVGQELSQPGFRIKPSDVVLPAGVPLGKYRRSIQPFENWTLICDENLEAQQRICNVSQVIEDQSGQTVFSWSLAASEDGKPFMILRTPPSAKADGSVSLQFPGRQSPVNVVMDGCNEVVCVGKVPVGPILREQIAKDAAPDISYLTTAGETITVTASLKGLATALSAIE
ncbi:invasion associated locus B family protein [Mesorhizobium sp. SB112]|uniref:invasion associated locus B family protein n=1 Tax=Mesorhizobium sp. SB112 TaxID=3151853 RepID=UPI003263EC8A